MIKEAISLLVPGESLTMEQAAEVMEEITSELVTPAQFGAFVTALRIKGETPDEIAGLAGVMRAKSIRVTTTGPVIDIVGTGGDNSNSFNISTAAAFVAAGAGLKVAKHGNRAMSSHCGSADVLEQLDDIRDVYAGNHLRHQKSPCPFGWSRSGAKINRGTSRWTLGWTAPPILLLLPASASP